MSNGIVFDYPAINRRLNRKPEPIVAVAVDDDYERAKKCIFGNPDCQVCNAQTNVSKLRAFLAKPLELTPESLGYVPPSVAMATLRAEVEQMERDQDILGLRLLADDKLLNRFE